MLKQKIVVVGFCFLVYFGLFPALICANNIRSLVNSLFGVNIFNPFASFSPFDNDADGTL